MPRILITDDHALIRRGLKQILLEGSERVGFGRLVVEEAENAEEALQKIKENWDVIVMDITMPGRSGLDVLKDIKLARPQLPVLILSMHSEDQFAVRMLKAGAAGYITKESAPQELVNAIKKVLSGGKYVSPSLAERLAYDLSHDTDKAPNETLSDREFQVMSLIASGKTVSQIAEKLGLSVKTISTYRTRVLEKMGMKTNAALTHFAIKNRLVE
ncbi:MAG: DNA-binding response regulator [Verrucomicrobia bacterium]|nr:MAG: DNA-binding response regulator [Verrucomicrobiota bacterium]